MLHQVGVSFDLFYDARKHIIKILESAQGHYKMLEEIRLMQVSQEWREERLKKLWSSTRRYPLACSTAIHYKILSVVMLGYCILWLLTGSKLE